MSFPIIEQQRQAKEAYEETAIAIRRQIGELGRSDLQVKISENLHSRAKTTADTEYGREIIRTPLTLEYNNAKAIDAANEARRKAAAQAERDIEFERRAREQRHTALEKVQQESRSAIRLKRLSLPNACSIPRARLCRVPWGRKRLLRRRSTGTG